MASLLSALGVNLSSPTAIIVTVIEFVLGFGLGFVLVKGIKYILFFFILLIVGDLLHIWNVGAESLARSVASGNVSAIEEVLRALAPFLAVIEPIFTNVVIVLGFIIGVAIALHS